MLSFSHAVIEHCRLVMGSASKPKCPNPRPSSKSSKSAKMSGGKNIRDSNRLQNPQNTPNYYSPNPSPNQTPNHSPNHSPNARSAMRSVLLTDRVRTPLTNSPDGPTRSVRFNDNRPLTGSEVILRRALRDTPEDAKRWKSPPPSRINRPIVPSRFHSRANPNPNVGGARKPACPTRKK